MATEHDHQVALFQWATINRKKYPALDLMFAVPNGGYRHITTARRLKAEGVKSGVPDIFLPVSDGCSHGLFIEMKAGKNNLTTNQINWMIDLRGKGFRVEVCRSWLEAAKVVCEYLKIYEQIIPEATCSLN